MPTYYLQEGFTDSSVREYKDGKTILPDSRLFLDDREHKNVSILKTIEANSWIEARYSI